MSPVKTSPKASVSTEKTGWSEGDVVKPSSMQEHSAQSAVKSVVILKINFIVKQ